MKQNAPPYEAILFDFDYTLADSSEGIIRCVNGALGALDLPLASAKEIRATIGLSLPDILIQLAGPSRRPLAPDFQRLFMQRADEIMADLTRIYPGVPDALHALEACHLRLGILSTKYRYRIEGVLQREGLSDTFELIVGGEDVHKHKPDPEGLVAALGRLGCRPDRLLYVGDSAVDAQAAERASVPFAAVLSGVTPAEIFARFPRRVILDDVSHLPPWLGCAPTSAEPPDKPA